MAEITRQGGDPTRVVGRRIFGGFLEGIIDWVLLGALTALFGIDVQQSAILTPVPGEVSEQEAQLAAVGLVYLLYFVGTKVVTLTLWGWTPGMLCVGVRCVRWDGRPPGMLRALWRSAFFSFFNLLCSVFFLGPMAVMSYAKAHRAWQDSVAGTYVVDNQWFGHMVIVSNDSVSAGPMSVRREEAAKLLKEEGITVEPLGARLPPNAKNGNPFMDRQLDTYVVWNARQGTFLAFDKTSGTWEPLD